MNWKLMPVLLLCFLLLASIQQSPVAASNSENIPDDSQENLSPSSESELDEASITVSNLSAGDNSEPADNVTPPTGSELNGPDITKIYPPLSENSESMGQNVTPFDDNFMLENGPDLTRCSLPSPDPTDNDPWVCARVCNNDDDQHTVYIYVKGAYMGYLRVGPYGDRVYSDLIYVWPPGRYKVKIRWYDHDDGEWHSQESAQDVTWISVFCFEIPLIPPPPSIGYAYAQIYNADDDQHYVYVYLDGDYKGYVKVPSETTRYTSYYKVLEGYHTMKIKWYDEDDAKWHENSLLHYVSGGEYQKYYFSLPLILPPIGYARAQIYNADDDQHDADVYLDDEYKECVKVPSETTRYTSYYTVSEGYHTMKIKWYDEDDAKWHENFLEYYVSGGEYQQYYFELPPILRIGYAYAEIYNVDDSSHTVRVYVDDIYKEDVCVPAGTRRYSSHFEVPIGDHTMKIERQDINWYSSCTEYVDYKERQIYCFMLPKIVNVAVILAEPSDVPHSPVHNSSYYEEYLLEEMQDYYEEVSYGAIDFTWQICDDGGSWYKLSMETSDYADDPELFIEEALWWAYEEIDYAQYDVIIVVFAGRSRPETGDNSSIEIFMTRKSFDTGDGVVNNSILVSETALVGPWAHEMAHALGWHLVGEALPDLYDKGDCDNWALMMHWGGGATTGSPPGIKPVHLCSYSKEKLGWLQYQNLDMVWPVVIESLPNMSLGDYVYRYRYWDDVHNVWAYFILEVRTNERQYSKWDVEVPGTGLVIYQIFEDYLAYSPYGKKYDAVKVVPNPEEFHTVGEYYSDLEAGVRFTVTDYYQGDTAYVMVVSVEKESKTEMVGASMSYSPTVQMSENVYEFVPWEPMPDLDLHAYTADGKHVGMNYDTGDYEVEIPGAVASGDFRGTIEWIFVPSDIEVYFSVTGENLETLGEEGAKYQLAIMYYDENGNRYNSPLAIDRITAGEVINYRYEITQNPDGTYSVVVISDNVTPTSSTNPIQPYWRNQLPVAITATASDLAQFGNVPSGVENVALWYRYSADNSVWDPWSEFDFDNEEPWSWEFDAPEGDGYYEFYTIATDKAGNIEAAPENADAGAGVDTMPPESSVDPIEPYWQNSGMTPFEVTATASDNLSGAANVELFYRYSPDNIIFGSWVFCSADNEEPWSWTFDTPEGDGYYEFHIIATDEASNVEEPKVADTVCGVDTVPPESSVDLIEPYWQNASMIPFEVLTTASDNLSGVASVELYYRYSVDNTTWDAWTSYSADNEEPWSWTFDVPEGDGYYEFCTLTTDVALNTEPVPDQADLNLGIDTTPPISSVDPIEPYWQEPASFAVSVTALDVLSGVTDVELYYQSSIDNVNWSEWKLFSIDNMAPYEWSFTAPDCYALYQFYSVATDVAGNVENASEAADATCCVVIPAKIDIDPDTLNLKSQGRWITAYIELPGVYDLVSIDLSTITLEGVVPAELHPTEIGDHDNDGIPDLIIKFDRLAVQSLVSVGEVELVITGKWHAVLFKGNDIIRVIEPGREQRGNRPEVPPGQSDDHPGKRFETPPGQSGEHPSQRQGKGKDKER